MFLEKAAHHIIGNPECEDCFLLVEALLPLAVLTIAETFESVGKGGGAAGGRNPLHWVDEKQ